MNAIKKTHFPTSTLPRQILIQKTDGFRKKNVQRSSSKTTVQARDTIFNHHNFQ